MHSLAATKAAMRSAPAETGALHLAGSKAMLSTSSWKTIIEDRFMTRKLPKRGLPPMHPGELLREEILPALDRPKTEIARLLGVSRLSAQCFREAGMPHLAPPRSNNAHLHQPRRHGWWNCRYPSASTIELSSHH